MMNCELCKNPARTHCESDEASLCWDCDARVHGANFLVARHSRTLLCHACQSLTPWKASGANLGNTFSLCRNCDGGINLDGEEESEGDNDSDIDSDLSSDDNDDGENQVLPCSSTTTTPPPPASSSSSDDDGNRDTTSELEFTVSLKRRRQSSASTDRNLEDNPSPADVG